MAYICFKISVSVEVLPLVKGGMLSFTPFLVRRSLTVNLLSAITWSPSSRRSSRPLSWVTRRSLLLPVHNFETKEKAPDGVIPTKSLQCCDVCSRSKLPFGHLEKRAFQ